MTARAPRKQPEVSDYEWLEDNYVEEAQRHLKQAPDATFIVTAFDALMILGAIQHEWKHPLIDAEYRERLREIGDLIGDRLIEAAPIVKPLIEDGWINPGTCRVCGCTDDEACPNGCSWVEVDLCSRCAGPVLVSPSGAPLNRG